MIRASEADLDAIEQTAEALLRYLTIAAQLANALQMELEVIKGSDSQQAQRKSLRVERGTPAKDKKPEPEFYGADGADVGTGKTLTRNRRPKP